MEPYLDLYGPGLTEDAESMWADVYTTQTTNWGHYFTVRCTAFDDESVLTAAEMLD